MPSPAPDRQPLDATGASLAFALCVLWGFNHVAAKLAAPGISLLMQASIRSCGAALLILLWAASRRIPVFDRDGSLGPGLAAGILFGLEFLCIFLGLGHTTAARMTLLLYIAPCVTALGLAWFVPGERLSRVQWAGVGLGSAGLVVAFADGFADGASATLLGDVCAILAGILWAATTVTIRATRLAAVSATKTTFYQLAVSAPMLLAGSVAIGEAGVVAITPIVAASLVYQTVVVAFGSLLVWFWLLTKYLASRLSVFTFLTPLFGVAAGAIVLDEPVSARFIAAAAIVGAGIVLVNWTGGRAAAAPRG